MLVYQRVCGVAMMPKKMWCWGDQVEPELLLNFWQYFPDPKWQYTNPQIMAPFFKLNNVNQLI